MISQHTPPGTKVVAVRNHEIGKCIGSLEIGSIYTVDHIEDGFEDPSGEAAFGVFIVEMLDAHEWAKQTHGCDFAYGLWQFRYFELPRSITICLTAAPADRELVDA